jgi:hypothetical protein
MNVDPLVVPFTPTYCYKLLQMGDWVITALDASVLHDSGPDISDVGIDSKGVSDIECTFQEALATIQSIAENHLATVLPADIGVLPVIRMKLLHSAPCLMDVTRWDTDCHCTGYYYVG